MVQVRAGSLLNLEAEIQGKPEPNVRVILHLKAFLKQQILSLLQVSWYKGDHDLESTDHVNVIVEPGRTALNIRDCNRTDSAKYTLMLRNDCGEKRATINVKVLGIYLLTKCLKTYLKQAISSNL